MMEINEKEGDLIWDKYSIFTEILIISTIIGLFIMHESSLLSTKRGAFWSGLILLLLTFFVSLNLGSQKIIDKNAKNNRNGYHCAIFKVRPENQKKFPNQIGQIICPPDFPLFNLKKLEKDYSGMVVGIITMVFWASIGGNLVASSLIRKKNPKEKKLIEELRALWKKATFFCSNFAPIRKQNREK